MTARAADDDIADAGHRPEIDGLRALAVLAVLVCHAHAAWLPGGFLGVDVFFVVSGFTVCMALARRTERTGSSSSRLHDALAFYARRIKRLFPALALCVVVTSLLCALTSPLARFSIRTGLSALVGGANLYLIKQGADYFAPAASLNFFTHTWSLGVEEQFYLLFPWLFAGLAHARNVTTDTRTRVLVVVVVVVTLASGAAWLHVQTFDATLAYFAMPTRLWELAVGCLAFDVVRTQRREASSTNVLASAALIALLACFAWGAGPVPTIVSTPVVVVATAALLFALRPGVGVARLLAARPFVVIGLRSYALYLWHWGLLATARWALVDGDDVAVRLGALACAFASAELSYRVVEQPLRHARWPREPAGVSGVFGMAAATCVAIAVLLGGGSSTTTRALRALGARAMPPAFDDVPLVQRALPCHHPRGAADPLRACLLQPDASKHTIYVVGDSHATNHVPSLQALAQERGDVAVRMLVEWGFITSLRGDQDCGSRTPCIPDAFGRYVAFLDEHLREGDALVFAIERDVVLHPGEMPRVVDDAARDSVRQRLLSLHALVQRHRAWLFVVDDVPKPCLDHARFVVDVMQHGRLDACATTKTVSRADRAPLTALLQALADAHPDDTRVVDVHDLLCTGEVCGVSRADAHDLLFGDPSPHLAQAHALVLVDAWRPVLAALWPAATPPAASTSSGASPAP